MTFSEKLKCIREEKGFTQKQVATAMGISQQAYGQYESGSREPKMETICRIAAALGVEWVELYPDNKSASMAYINAANDFMKEHPGGFKKISPDEAAERGFIDDQTAASLNAIQSQIHQKHILEDFAALNDKGQEEAAKRVHELTLLPAYSNNIGNG